METKGAPPLKNGSALKQIDCHEITIKSQKIHRKSGTSCEKQHNETARDIRFKLADRICRSNIQT
jgi:hypothetical protein